MQLIDFCWDAINARWLARLQLHCGFFNLSVPGLICVNYTDIQTCWNLIQDFHFKQYIYMYMSKSYCIHLLTETWLHSVPKGDTVTTTQYWPCGSKVVAMGSLPCKIYGPLPMCALWYAEHSLKHSSHNKLWTKGTNWSYYPSHDFNLFQPSFNSN